MQHGLSNIKGCGVRGRVTHTMFKAKLTGARATQKIAAEGGRADILGVNGMSVIFVFPRPPLSCATNGYNREQVQT